MVLANNRKALTLNMRAKAFFAVKQGKDKLPHNQLIFG